MDEPSMDLEVETMRAVVSALDEMGIGIVVGRNGKILDASPSFCNIFGRSLDELRRTESVRILAPEDRPIVTEIRSLPHDQDVSVRHKVVGLGPDGERIPVEAGLTSRPVTRDVTEVVAVVRDLRAEGAKDELLERFSTLVDRGPVGVMMWDGSGVEAPLDLRLVFANVAASRMLGLDPHRVIGQTILEVFPEVRPDDAARMLALCGTERSEHFDDVAARQDTLQLYRWSGVALAGHVVAVLFEDITRERAEEVRRRELLERLVDTSDEQRRHLAMNVHDDPVQQLAAAAILVDGLRRHPDVAERAERLDTIDLALRSAMASLRHLVFELSPPELSESGLEAAVRSAADYVFADSSTTISVEVSLSREPSKPAQVAAFRVVAEALTNAHKHANADHVEVDLREDGRWLELRVADDGSGIGPEAHRPGHIGLRSMRERAVSLGGDCAITSRQDGTGTLVSARLPIDARVGIDDATMRTSAAQMLDSTGDETLRRERDSLTIAAATAREDATRARAQLRDALALAKAVLDPSLSVSQIAAAAAQRVAVALGDGGAVRLASSDGTMIEEIASWHPDEAQSAYFDRLFGSPRVSAGTYSGVVMGTGVPMVIDHPLEGGWPTEAPRPAPPPTAIRSAMLLPLQLGDEMFGTLTLLRDVTPLPYTAEDVEFAACLAERVAVALYLARSRER